MEQETLFTASKWEILKLLESGPLSPIELASLSRTSVANVSQQLRLLEMAGLVKSERVSNRDKGQPRILYSISGNTSYLISTSNSFVEKKLHKMSIYNKIIMRIWFHPQKELHYFLEKGFWQIDHFLNKIDLLAVSVNPLTFYLVTDQSLPQLNPLTVSNLGGLSQTITFKAISIDELPSNSYTLFDSNNTIGGFEEKN